MIQGNSFLVGFGFRDQLPKRTNRRSNATPYESQHVQQGNNSRSSQLPLFASSFSCPFTCHARDPIPACLMQSPLSPLSTPYHFFLMWSGSILPQPVKGSWGSFHFGAHLGDLASPHSISWAGRSMCGVDKTLLMIYACLFIWTYVDRLVGG